MDPKSSRRAKLSAVQADLIRAEYKAGGVTQRSIAKKYGVSQMAIWQVLQGITYQASKAAA